MQALMTHDTDAQGAIAPLSPARHGARRWRRLTDYSFARALQTIPVVMAEAEIVATAMPLVFIRAADGQISPVALMRLRAHQSPFIGGDGQWQAPYIPALLRVHPFSARVSDGGQNDNRMVLLVDESTGHVTDDPNHERFFDPFGMPTPALEQVVSFFKQYEANRRDTDIAMAALIRLRTADGDSLFQPLQGLAGQGPVAQEGADLLGLSRSHFATLPDATIGALRDTGALGLVMAHFVSLHQIGWLDRAEKALDRKSHSTATQYDRAADHATRLAPDVSGFLSALAMSHHRETPKG